MQYNREAISTFKAHRDLEVVLEEADAAAVFNNDYLSKLLNTAYQKDNDSNLTVDTYSATSPLRRARAGTMPSMPIAPIEGPLNSIMELTIESTVHNRHRSESLTLPIPPSGFSWRRMDAEPVSPSTEEFLQQGDDVARTLRSIGLDNDKYKEGVSSLAFRSSHLTHSSATGPPSLPLASRNRSHSVNNASLYQLQQRQKPQYMKSVNFSIPITDVENSETNINNRQRNSVNRARSVSMGRMDYLKNRSSSIWKNDLNSISDNTLYEVNDLSENTDLLSLGDSELLANMLNTISTGNSSQSQDGQSDTNNPVSTVSANSKQQPQQKQNTSRSLWIGNIHSTLTADTLRSFFSAYGPIESVRLLVEKECAFVNFFHVDDAVNAKDDVLNHHGGKIGTSIVRIGFGKAESPAAPTPTITDTPVESQPTRALWIGSLPTGATQDSLQQVFSTYGNIESIRVLSFKNCAFVNFEKVDSAISAREALMRDEATVGDLYGIRVGFAKAPAACHSNFSSKMTSKTNLGADHSQKSLETWSLMQQLGVDEEDVELVTSLHSSSYFESIPPVPEYGYSHKPDPTRLKDTRKQLDLFIANEDTSASFDSIALEYMEEAAELCSDYIGNIIIQRLFERCSDDVKTTMLKTIAPHLAALGIHKNGTWAAQKIIDSVTTVDQIQIVGVHIQPFIPALLLDQFGNYVVQCCLRLKGNTQYITNAIADRLVTIAQGRFGARAIRGILDSKMISTSHQILIVATILKNASVLALHSNGSILVTWLIDVSTLNNRITLLSAQLVSKIVQISNHKLGSQILLKIVNQDTEPKARQNILKALEDDDVLSDIAREHTRGLAFVIKVMSSEFLTSDEKATLGELAYPILRELQGIEFKKAQVEFVPNVQA